MALVTEAEHVAELVGRKGGGHHAAEPAGQGHGAVARRIADAGLARLVRRAVAHDDVGGTLVGGRHEPDRGGGRVPGALGVEDGAGVRGRVPDEIVGPGQRSPPITNPNEAGTITSPQRTARSKRI